MGASVVLCADLEALIDTWGGMILREKIECVPKCTEGREYHRLPWIISQTLTLLYELKNNIRTISFNEAASVNIGSVVTLLACYLAFCRDSRVLQPYFPSVNTNTLQLVNTCPVSELCLCSIPLSLCMCVRASVWVCIHVCACGP